jgi:dCTP diphosphatase
MSSIEALIEELRDFAEARDWAQFHSLRNLVLALVGEIGELAAELQWVPDEDVFDHLNHQDKRDSFESELADVATYLLRICDIASVDLASVIRKKMAINEMRYPVEKSKGSSAKYDNLSES